MASESRRARIDDGKERASSSVAVMYGHCCLGFAEGHEPMGGAVEPIADEWPGGRAQRGEEGPASRQIGHGDADRRGASCADSECLDRLEPRPARRRAVDPDIARPGVGNGDERIDGR